MIRGRELDEIDAVNDLLDIDEYDFSQGDCCC